MLCIYIKERYLSPFAAVEVSSPPVPRAQPQRSYPFHNGYRPCLTSPLTPPQLHLHHPSRRKLGSVSSPITSSAASDLRQLPSPRVVHAARSSIPPFIPCPRSVYASLTGEKASSDLPSSPTPATVASSPLKTATPSPYQPPLFHHISHHLHLCKFRSASTIVKFVSSDLAPTATLCPPPVSNL
ncbi:hypothetical protein PIB30_074595 [Stylosanthes scabra]|uniref:Uncharacterized protein n=1 Tax=Stylosanthes scabra TaxID=79078 RepID=A0ABU6QP98_9FABA|nr:hypothetical protein [Stylosanthes scabra]